LPLKFTAMKPGAVHLDCSTVDVDARNVAQAAEDAGLLAIDMPPSPGGIGGATNLMAGGSQRGL
jgi:3-hydroxyisobutyrate dehydrogenase